MATSASMGRRRPLSLDSVVAIAVEIADSEGLEGVTVRRLASHFGVAPMTIYGYVESKDDLLDRMTDAMTDRFEVPAITTGNWMDQVIAIMQSFRELLKHHPWLASLLTARRVVSVGLTRSIEATLSHLRSAGFSGKESVKVYAGLFAYTLGFVMFELPRSLDTSDEDLAVTQRLHQIASERRFTVIDELATELSTMARYDSFDAGLRALVEGYALRLGEQKSPGGSE